MRGHKTEEDNEEKEVASSFKNSPGSLYFAVFICIISYHIILASLTHRSSPGLDAPNLYLSFRRNSKTKTKYLYFIPAAAIWIAHLSFCPPFVCVKK